VPSVGQGEFFSKLQQLVEQVSEQNDGKKVALWAFSFGPQYTLSFLHRMTQRWKDQYIDAFIASSPVWSGAPAALSAFINGNVSFAANTPDLPKQCHGYTATEGSCFTGQPTASFTNYTIGDCCDKSNKASTSTNLWNYFEANKTCLLLSVYITTETCTGGILGYKDDDQLVMGDDEGRGHTAFPTPPPFSSSSSSSPSAASNSLEGPLSTLRDTPAPITPALINLIGRACPSLMWAWPRAGTNTSNSWTKDDVLVYTEKKNFTAFDYDELLKYLGVSATEREQQQFLANEPDLNTFASPGVDTLITYGHGIGSSGPIHLGSWDGIGTPKSIQIDLIDGDDLVPLESSLRGEVWYPEMANLGKKLLHRGFAKQPHANCFPGLVTGVSNTTIDCGFIAVDFLYHRI